MSKLLLSEVPNGISNTVTNTNFGKIEKELNDNTLKRRTEVGEDNTVHTDIDMNSNRIYNLPKPESEHEPLRRKDVSDAISATEDARDAANKANAALGRVEIMEEDFQNFLLSSGYQDLGDYEEGLEITARNQIFRKDGELYRAGAVLEFPYTTTGDWSTEGDLFVSVGDAELRKNLAGSPADGFGAALVNRAAVVAKSIEEIKALSLPAGSVIELNAGSRSGTFDVVAGDFSAEVSADVLSGVYVSLADNPSGNMKAAVRRVGGNIEMAWWGAKDNVDCTLSGQAALDYAESIGGGKVVMPVGTVYVSNLTSLHPYAAWLIPKNVTLAGAGKFLTTVTRPSAERAIDGILIANKGYDLNLPDFGADGNLVFEDFTITDGATSPSRSGGDLIGMGNNANVIVRRVHFGVHDQHGVDISGVNNIHIHDCTGNNLANGSYNRSSTVQVDGAAGGMIGQFPKQLNSINVLVENNKFKTANSRELLHVGHKPASHGLHRNIKFLNNILDGAYQGSSFVVYNDANSGFDGLEFIGNTIIANHPDAYTLNLAFNVSGEIKNTKVQRNLVKGTFRVGIYVGSTGNINEAKFENIDISNNTVDQTSSSTSVIYGIGATGLVNSRIQGNIINSTATDTDASLCGIYMSHRNDGLVVTGNTVKVSAPNVVDLSVPNVDVYGIRQNYLSGVAYSSSVDISDNDIEQSSVRYAIAITTVGSGFDPAVDKGTISGNKFRGILPTGAYSLFDAANFSAMDNGGTSVVMPNGTVEQTISASEIHTISNYGGIKSYQGKVRLVAYAKTAQGFQQINNVVFASNAYGVVFSNITRESFSLSTGSGGVSGLLNGTTFAYTPLLSASISIKAFI